MRLCCWLSLLFPLLMTDNAAAESVKRGLIGGDLKFIGKVVALPCSIVPGDRQLFVDFEQIAAKDLIREKTTSPLPFAIHLVGCNAAVFKSVTITFSGNESTALPDHLSVVSLNHTNMSAVGIGLRLKDGRPVMLNKEVLVSALSQGSTVLNFSTFVESIPAELEAGRVGFGPFTSSANYTLSYQ